MNCKPIALLISVFQTLLQGTIKHILPGTCGRHALPQIWPHTPGRQSIAPEPPHLGVGVQAEHSLDSDG